jgi:hypothetical protein
MTNQVVSEEIISASELRRIKLADDQAFILILGKFLVWRLNYEIVEARLEDMLDYLIEDTDYLPEELVCGNPIYDHFGRPIDEMETVLCLKQMATLPHPKIIETGWATFMIAP